MTLLDLCKENNKIVKIEEEVMKEQTYIENIEYESLMETLEKL